MIKYIPNALTICRIVLTPVFIWITLYASTTQALAWAWAVFMIAAITDWLDGKIARKYNIVSNFGKIWDPLADKFIVLSALAALTWAAPFKLHWTVFLIITLREVGVTVQREIYARRKVIMAADKWGKLKTVLQMTGSVGCLGCWALDYTPIYIINVGRAWFWIVTAVTVFSGFNYLRASKQSN